MAEFWPALGLYDPVFRPARLQTRGVYVYIVTIYTDSYATPLASVRGEIRTFRAHLRWDMFSGDEPCARTTTTVPRNDQSPGAY
jgi:hypothetical protein